MEQYKQNQRSICKNCGDGIVFHSGTWEHPQFINCNGGCLKPEPVTYKEATHKLSCVHSINSVSRKEYSMPCIILGELPNNKVKILVFGYKTTKPEFTNNKQVIRYVFKDRLTLIKSEGNLNSSQP